MQIEKLEQIAQVLRPLAPEKATLGDLRAWQVQTGYSDPTACHGPGRHSGHVSVVYHGHEYPVSVCGKHTMPPINKEVFRNH